MKDKKTRYTLYFIGIIPVIWFSLIIAPILKGGIFSIVENFDSVVANPFNIVWCENSLRSILIFLLIYILGVLMYDSSIKNYRRKEEHGSASWGSAKELNKKYMQLPESQNKTLTKNVKLGLNARAHKRNLNVLVVGGSGAGKTFSYCKPNIMQANSSFVTLDPKGEILRDTGHLLESKGYEVRVLDLINMEKSHCYNPFEYLRNDNDVQRLVTNLFKSTTPKGSQSNDPFWDTAASMLLLALIYYLVYRAPKDELKSIQITLMSRLEKFNLESMAKLTNTDELSLSTLGEKKVALFAIIPDNDTSFNFLVSILYTQLFQQLFYTADYKYGGSLPIPVHFVMDEFANVSLPDDFDKILSVMRSRNVSVSIILQNLAQLKALFDKQWESIIGNCDTFLYLGGNEQSTHKYVSELLGKETIDTDSHTRSYGSHGSYSTNYQNTGRELLTPDEVRMLDNKYALLFIRGEKPVKDEKYNMLKHPNIDLSANGKGKPYIHGLADKQVAEINFDENEEMSEDAIQVTKDENIENEYELYSEFDIEKYFELKS